MLIGAQHTIDAVDGTVGHITEPKGAEKRQNKHWERNRKMADEDTKQTETKEQPKEEKATETEEKEAHTGKGDEFSAKKYKAERDTARTELAELQKQLEGLKGTDQEITNLKAKVKEQQEALEKSQADAVVEKAKILLLSNAGCINIEDALKLMGNEDDIDEFKKSKPYLFKVVQTGSTGAKPEGATKNNEEAKWREVAGLPPK